MPSFPGLRPASPRGNDQTTGAWRLDIEPETPAAETTYLHVLWPTDTKTEKMPDCSCVVEGDTIKVKIGELDYVFKNNR